MDNLLDGCGITKDHMLNQLSAAWNAKNTPNDRAIRAHQPATYVHIQGVGTEVGPVPWRWRLCMHNE